MLDNNPGDYEIYGSNPIFFYFFSQKIFNRKFAAIHEFKPV